MNREKVLVYCRQMVKSRLATLRRLDEEGRSQDKLGLQGSIVFVKVSFTNRSLRVERKDPKGHLQQLHTEARRQRSPCAFGLVPQSLVESIQLLSGP